MAGLYGTQGSINAGLLGINPAELKQARISALLGGLGAGLLGGNNWQTGLAGGVQLANQGMRQAGDDMTQTALTNWKLQQAQAEQDAKAKQQAALDNLTAGITDPQQRLLATADPSAYVGAASKGMFPTAAEQAQAKASEQLAGLLGGQPTAVPAAPPPPTQPRAYNTKLSGFETSGGTNLVNPLNPNVSGPYHIDQTKWPQTAGMEPDKALAFVNQSNSADFQKQFSKTPTDADMYGMHRLGATGYANLLAADPNAPAVSVVGKVVAGDNPDLAGKSVGQVLNMFKSRMGVGATWQAADASSIPAGAPEAAAGPAADHPVAQAATASGMDLNNLSQADATRLNIISTQAGLGAPFKAASENTKTPLKIWDAKANNGKGGMVYADGPYKGQLAEAPVEAKPPIKYWDPAANNGKGAEVFAAPNADLTGKIAEVPKDPGQGITFTDSDGNVTQIGGPGMKPLQAGDSKALVQGQETYRAAQDLLGFFQVAHEAVKRFPQSGIFGGAALGGERVLNFLGLPNNAPAGEVLKAINAKMSVLNRVPGSGSTSNYEMQAYQQAAPGLLNTQEGNVALVTIGEKLLRRSMHNYEMYRDYVAKNGSSAGFQPEETPALAPEDYDTLFGASGALTNTPAPAAAAAPEVPADLPAGTIYAGTNRKTGKPVWQKPDGSQVSEP